MTIFRKKIAPTFLKSESGLKQQLKELEALKNQLTISGQKLIEQDIQLIKYGILGEDNIDFELKNSHLPIYIIKDVYLKYEDLSAQIDFLVFTSKVAIILEIKNLFGHITINSRGEFIRSLPLNNKVVKEGIYSPIVQNERHYNLIKERVLSFQTNPLMRYMVDKSINQSYYPLVVLANPKTIINLKQAPKDIRSKIIRADQLVQTIKTIHQNSSAPSLKNSEQYEWAENYLKADEPKPNTFLAKYQPYLIENKIASNIDQELEKLLKSYRLDLSRKLNIKAYYIFNNAQMAKIISIKPLEKSELRKVSMFTDDQIKKYGDDIIEIIKNTIA